MTPTRCVRRTLRRVLTSDPRGLVAVATLAVIVSTTLAVVTRG